MAPDRVLVGHSGTTNKDYLQRLYNTGCAVGLGHSATCPAEESAGIIESLAECIRRGYAAQTVLANDAGRTATGNLSRGFDVPIRARDGGPSAAGRSV